MVLQTLFLSSDRTLRSVLTLMSCQSLDSKLIL